MPRHENISRVYERNASAITAQDEITASCIYFEKPTPLHRKVSLSVSRPGLRHTVTSLYIVACLLLSYGTNVQQGRMHNDKILRGTVTGIISNPGRKGFSIAILRGITTTQIVYSTHHALIVTRISTNVLYTSATWDYSGIHQR